jgi:hypothetical protein
MASRIAVHCALTLRQLRRSRLTLLLLVAMPVAFGAVTLETAPLHSVSLELASVPEAEMVMPPRFPNRRRRPEERGALVDGPGRSVSLIFVGISSVAVLAAFVALTVLQRSFDTKRRLVLSGYRPWELLAGELVALLCVVVVLGAFEFCILKPFVSARHPAVLLLGLLLAGWVYGCYGLLVASLVRNSFEGMLLITLLSYLDVAWLQNPVDYAEARARLLIRWLPAHLPSQVCFIGALEDYPVAAQALGAFGYGAALLTAAVTAFTWKVRLSRSTRVRASGGLISPDGPEPAPRSDEA